MGPFIGFGVEAGNNVKGLEIGLSIYPLCFHAVVGLSGLQFFVLFGAAAGPVENDAIDFIVRAEAEGYRQFGLGEIAGAAVDHSGLGLPSVENADRGAEGIAIGLRTP